MTLPLGSPYPERTRQQHKLYEAYLAGKGPKPPADPDFVAPRTALLGLTRKTKFDLARIAAAL